MSSSAVVVSAVLGHLADTERQQLWRYVAEQMAVGAPAVVEVLPPERPIDVPPTRYRSLPVGDFVYEGWQQGRPLDERHMAWTMTYRVRRGDDTVAEYSIESTWRCFDVHDVVSERPSERPCRPRGGPLARRLRVLPQERQQEGRGHVRRRNAPRRGHDVARERTAAPARHLPRCSPRPLGRSRFRWCRSDGIESP